MAHAADGNYSGGGGPYQLLATALREGGCRRGHRLRTFAAPDEALDVDTTLPGRAFRLVQTLPSHGADRPRLWVPLLDGSERLGVLDVQVDDPEDLYDPGLRVQCR
ncbi:hypothetical protein [Nocardia asiatica]|uniref:hypothetical protein n=1 Tax=Nocardia asiatica TaxID=209252 RepID=UPI003EDFB11F